MLAAERRGETPEQEDCFLWVNTRRVRFEIKGISWKEGFSMASLRHMPPPGGDKASGLDGDLQGRRIRGDSTPADGVKDRIP